MKSAIDKVRSVPLRALALGALAVLGIGSFEPGCGFLKKKGDDASASADSSSDSPKKPSASSSSAGSVAASSAGATATSPVTSKEPGRFTYAHKPATDPDDKIVEPLFDMKRMDGVVKAMGVYTMPRDIPVVASDEAECKKTVNAFYMPPKHAIYVCYPLAKVFYQNFLDQGMTDKAAANATLDAMVFTLIHEMGHALIAEDSLGVTGKEEDAVDELATLVLVQNKKADWAFDGAMGLSDLGKNAKHLAFMDEHSLGPQRLGDVLCLIYGSDQKKFTKAFEDAKAGSPLADPDLHHRLPKCPSTYTKTDKAWTTLLAPHVRG